MGSFIALFDLFVKIFELLDPFLKVIADLFLKFYFLAVRVFWAVRFLNSILLALLALCKAGSLNSETRQFYDLYAEKSCLGVGVQKVFFLTDL